jgi:hypothetical protein
VSLLRSATRVIVAGVAGTAAGFLLLLLPVLHFAIPLEVREFVRHPLGKVLAFAALLVLGPERIVAVIPWRTRERLSAWVGRMIASRPGVAAAAVARRATGPILASLQGRLPRLDPLSARALRGPVTIAAGTAAALMLLTWIPHYLTWPWWPDVDQFAVSAQSWSVGIVPYRDQLDFDFPGPIYLHYILGKVFGWGATVAFHAMDAGFVVLLGVALWAWSRRLFGSALPGLVSYLTYLCTYLDLDVSMVAQRDWHGPLFVVLGLLALDVWPGRQGRIISALALAVALAFRPQEVVFLPAMAAAVAEGERRAGEPWWAAIRPLLEWAAYLALSLLVSFSPLIVAGTLDDLIRAVRSAGEGSYNRMTWFWFTEGLRVYFRKAWTLGVLAAVTLVALAGPLSLRRPARTWALALLGVFFYKPLSPWPHPYLDQPIALIWAINLAILVAWLLSVTTLTASVRLAAIAAVAACGVPGLPRFCTVGPSLRAVGPLLRGEDPAEEPPGCIRQFASKEWPSDRYRWDDYRAVLSWIRRSTPGDARIADLLWNVPFPPVNGPTGRLTPFPAAGGYIHLWMVDPGLLDAYVRVLKERPNILVVWSPGKPNRFFPELDRAVHEDYRPVSRFGDIEVWRHKRAETPIDSG